MNDSPDTQNDNWAACPEGTVRGLVSQLQTRKRNEKIQRGVAIVAMLFVSVFLGSYVAGWLTPDSKDFGGISCRQVVEHAEGYVTQSLDAETRGKISAHLKQCDHCRPIIENLQKENSLAESAMLQLNRWLELTWQGR
jgi:hypothetical protein